MHSGLIYLVYVVFFLSVAAAEDIPLCSTKSSGSNDIPCRQPPEATAKESSIRSAMASIFPYMVIYRTPATLTEETSPFTSEDPSESSTPAISTPSALSSTFSAITTPTSSISITEETSPLTSAGPLESTPVPFCGKPCKWDCKYGYVVSSKGCKTCLCKRFPESRTNG